MSYTKDNGSSEPSQFFWLIDELDYGVILIDKDLKILWLNHAMEDLFSAKREKVQGIDVVTFLKEYIVPQLDDGDTLREKVSSAVAAGVSVRDIECRFKNPARDAQWVDYSSQIIENGPFSGMRMDIFQNVTLRKQLEQELSQHFGHLGEMIEERTRELRTLNEKLQQEIEDRRAVEDELFKERDFSSRLIKGSPAFIVAIDEGGRVVMMNESMLSALGYQKEEVLSKDYFSLCMPEPDRTRIFYLFQKMKVGADPLSYENTLVTKDGRNLLVEWLGRPVYRDNGELDYYFGIGIDITEQRRAQTALAQSEDLYRTIFENNGSATIIVNEDATIALANHEFYRIFGYSPEETVGRSWIELVGKVDAERMKECIRLHPVDPGLASDSFEFLLLDKKGDLRSVVTRIARIPGTGRSVLSILDVTEKKRAEEEIFQQNRHLSMLNQVTVATSDVKTLDELLSVALDRTLELVNFDAGAIYMVDAVKRRATLKVQRGLPDWYLKEMEHLEVGEEPYSRVYSLGEPWYLEKKDIGILSSASIPFLAGEDVIGAIHLVTSKQYSFKEREKETLWSISKQIGSAIQKQMLQDHLEKAYRESTLYLDIISHDINNANNVSIMYAELLSDMVEGEKKEFAQKLVGSINRSIEIIGNVSKIRKLYEDKPALKPTDLDAVIRSEIRNFSDANIQYGGTSAIVLADYLFPEIFVNLIGNSVKFGGKDVNINIRVEERANEVEVAVEDNGPGIPDKVKSLIFNRFQRGETKASGKGLGLYLSRMLVERYGGSIWVEDRVKEHPEMGALIKFRLHKS